MAYIYDDAHNIVGTVDFSGTVYDHTGAVRGSVKPNIGATADVHNLSGTKIGLVAASGQIYGPLGSFALVSASGEIFKRYDGLVGYIEVMSNRP
jgi:hypothetical protein